MPKAILEPEPDFRPVPVPEGAPSFSDLLDQAMSPVGALGPAGHIGDIKEIEKELDLIAAGIRTFYFKQPDQVLRECSGFSGRLTELRVLIHRREAGSRLWLKLRTQQIDVYLEELDRQWKTASRLIEVNRQDIQLSGGQP